MIAFIVFTQSVHGSSKYLQTYSKKIELKALKGGQQELVAAFDL